MKKIISVSDAAKLVKSNSSLMIGGFLRCGTPTKLIDELIKNKTGNLTLIANDTSYPEHDRGKLIVNKLVKKAIVTHIGTNPETGRQMNAGELEVQLVPMGTLVERIRSAGAGLGGFLTPTGIGTIVEEGKETLEIDGRKYLLEKPLKADFALIRGSVTDTFGNVVYHGTTQTFNPMMAMAAEHVICGTEKIVEVGELDPNHVVTSGILVDAVVGGAPEWKI